MARLGEICTVVSGTTPKSTCPEYWDGNLNWVTPAELTDECDIIYESQRKITQQAVVDSSLKSFPAGTVLLSSRAPIGKVAIAGTEMYCNQGFKNLVCSDKIYNRYLYHFLKDKTSYLNSLGRGATFKEISKSIVENIEIPLPPLDEQRKIAAVLDKVSELIAKRRQQLDKLDELVKARFVEMFGDPVENSMGWEKIALGKRCDIITGNTPSRADPENYGNFIEWIKSDNINTPAVLLTKAQEYLSETGFHKCRFVEAGSLLMTCIAGSINCIGNVAVTDRRVAFNQQINAIVPKQDDVLYLYWLMQISKPAIQSTINMALKGILSKGQLSEMAFPFPPLQLQNQFSVFVKQTEKTKTIISRSLEKLETLKKALMQGYFG